MTSPTPESAADGVENLDSAQMQADLERSPEEKRNREQSAASDETAVNERQEERPAGGHPSACVTQVRTAQLRSCL
jgi:hypothetical protein